MESNKNKCNQIDDDISKINPVIYLSLNINDALNHYRVLKNFNYPSAVVEKFCEDFYKFYKKHILTCEYFINSSNLLNKRIVIEDADNDYSPEKIASSFLKTTYNQNKWLIDLIKSWPYFTDLSDIDLTALIHKSQFIAFAFKISEFKVNGECFSVFDDNVWHSKKVMIKYYGYETTQKSFQIHDKINELRLTEKERALFYPFILTQCDHDQLQDKRLFFDLKNFYTNALFTEFFSNKRDINFMKILSQVFAQLSSIVNGYSITFQ